MNNGELILKAEGVEKGYVSGGKRIEVLRGVDLEVKRGEFVSIRGESGCGKTTLLNVLSGLDEVDRGRIYWGEEELGSLKEEERRRLRGRFIGLVFQSHYLVPELNVLENVLLPVKMKGKIGEGELERARELLERVGLRGREEHLVNEVSGGEAQRVGIVRALMRGPRLVIADEPTGNLDPRTADEVMGLFMGMCREDGVGLVLVTHHPEYAGWADRRGELREGVLYFS